jgi:DNA-binding transcriptional MerR regulator
MTTLSADTLRMWERRYGFPKPGRRGSQIRVYSDADVERLTLVARALKQGFRAGEVIHHSLDELRTLLINATQRSPFQPTSPTVDALLEAVTKDDTAGLRNGLRQAVATLGPRRFITEVAGPLIQQAGDAWCDGRLGVRQEHYLSAAISTQLRSLLNAYEADTEGPVVVLATLSEERHGLGLDMAALYLAVAGFAPRMLGVDVPPAQIVDAARALRARVVGLSISRGSDAELTSERVRWLLRELPSTVELWLGGQGAPAPRPPNPRIFSVLGWADVDRELARIRGLPAASPSAK